MTAEELAGNSDETDPALKQGGGQVRPDARAIFPLIEGNQRWKENRGNEALHDRIAQIDPALELEIVFPDLERRCRIRLGTYRLCQRKDLPTERLTEFLGAF